jgi:erythronate-4-phosphate dehydrogenase
VGTLTIGTDHVDLGYLASRGIAFASAPGSNANSVAEYVAAALLVWSRRSGEPLRGKTIGVVGVGHVGSKVVRVAQALGMSVLLNDPPLERKTGDRTYRPLDELMQADVITLHVPLEKAGPDATHHLFEETRLNRMKRGVLLINTARGAVVKTGALRAALDAQKVGDAILDVWEGEPGIDTRLLNQVTLATPHIAGYSFDGKLNAVRAIDNELHRFLGIPAETEFQPEPVPPEAATIRIPEDVLGDEEMLCAAVRQAYDIELDDYMLRQIVSLPAAAQRHYFMRLRAEYRTRREFFNRIVELSPQQGSVRKTLTDLGFRTAMIGESH